MLTCFLTEIQIPGSAKSFYIKYQNIFPLLKKLEKQNIFIFSGSIFTDQHNILHCIKYYPSIRASDIRAIYVRIIPTNND